MPRASWVKFVAGENVLVCERCSGRREIEEGVEISRLIRIINQFGESHWQCKEAAAMQMVPIKYEIEGVPFIENVTERHDKFIIDYRGDGKWCVSDGMNVLLVSGLEWEWEPMPSGRSEQFIADTRFASAEEAFTTFKAYVERKANEADKG